MDAIAEVKKELKALQEVGVKISTTAYRAAEKIAVEYYENGMSVSEIADFCISDGKLVCEARETQDRLARLKELTDQFIAEGFGRDEASRRAYLIVSGTLDEMED